MPMMSKADKLPMETEPVSLNSNTSWTLIPGHQTLVAHCWADNPTSFPGSHEVPFIKVKRQKGRVTEQETAKVHMSRTVEVE